MLNLVIKRIRNIILKDKEGKLLLKRKKDFKFPTKGYCYVACEAIYHIVPGGKSFSLRLKDDVHWFLKYNNQIIDPTYDQFLNCVPYELGIGRGFLTKYPSKRSQFIIDEYMKY